jgi:hypothetical protein
MGRQRAMAGRKPRVLREEHGHSAKPEEPATGKHVVICAKAT